MNIYNEDHTNNLPSSAIYHKELKHTGVERNDMVNQDVFGQGGLTFGFTVLNYTNREIVVLDKFGNRFEVAPNVYLQPTTTDSVMIAFKYVTTPRSSHEDITGSKVVVSKALLRYQSVYLLEADIVIGYPENMYTEKHPFQISAYDYLEQDILSLQSKIPEGAGFNISININSDAPDHYLHEVLYVCLPWMSIPIKVYPTHISSKEECTMTFLENRGDKQEILEQFTFEYIQPGKVECISLMDGKFNITIAVSEQSAAREGERHKAYLINELFTANDIEKELALEVKRKEALINELILKHKKELAEHKNKIDMLTISNEEYKITNEKYKKILAHHEATFDYQKQYNDARANELKYKQEQEKTSREEAKSFFQYLKDKDTMITATVAIISAVVSYYVAKKK